MFCSLYFWVKKAPYWFRSKGLISSFLKASFMRTTGIRWIMFSESKSYSTSMIKSLFQKKNSGIEKFCCQYQTFLWILPVKTCKYAAILKMMNTFLNVSNNNIRFSNAVQECTFSMFSQWPLLQIPIFCAPRSQVLPVPRSSPHCQAPPCPLGRRMSPEDSDYTRTCFQAQVILKGEIMCEVPDLQKTIIHADTECSTIFIFAVPWLMPKLCMFK